MYIHEGSEGNGRPEKGTMREEARQAVLARLAEGSELGGASAPRPHPPRSRESNKGIHTLVALLLDLEALREVLLVILPRDLAAFGLLVYVVTLVVKLVLMQKMRSQSIVTCMP